MLRRTPRPATDTMWFRDACSRVSSTADRAECHYRDHRFTLLVTLGALR